MKIFENFILIFGPLFILGCFFIYWLEPRFSLWQMDKSIVKKKQSLPLQMMFLWPHATGRFLVQNTEPQFVLAGPDLTLFYGIYDYKVKIVPDCEGKELGFMDVTRKRGNIGLGAKEIVAKSAGREQIDSMGFEADNAFDYEFRLFSRGRCSFEIKEIWLERQKIDFRTFARVIWQKTKKIVK